MQIKNGTAFFKDGSFGKTNVSINHGKISDVSSFAPEADAIDAEGMYVVPGYIDLHIHGADGSDCCDGTVGALDIMAAHLAKQGVTSFCATTMTLGEDVLSEVAEAVKTRMADPAEYSAKICGINMEGPFVSKAKRGAQNEKFIVNPDYDFFSRVNEKSGYHVKLIDVAPELDGAMEFIQKASKDCVVSIAHTQADYDTAVAAFKNGASHVTHLYNAMPAFTHRAPGVIGAAAEHTRYVELICDGIHVHPAVVKATFAMFGDRVCIISDAMKACGLPDGEYELGKQAVFVRNGCAYLANGSIAASTTNLAECVRRTVKFGVPLEAALKAATINPARAIGEEGRIGSIETGAEADILILDKELHPKTIIVGGKILPM
ncbi:MAG: N-acetylglucosamine-6-phosphate deacetylase [Clostridiales bacterium]|nr:N-acetylglucosamine-6-phosphate deacetylase [Clostridiales bacterium]